MKNRCDNRLGDEIDNPGYYYHSGNTEPAAIIIQHLKKIPDDQTYLNATLEIRS